MQLRALALVTALLLAGCAGRDDPTVVRPASSPSSTVVDASPSPPSATSSTSRLVKIFLVLIGDNVPKGAQTFGCEDAITSVERTVAASTPPLEAAIQALLAERTSHDPLAGPYSAFVDANMTLDSATISNGKATIRLKGQLNLGGVCDDPRIEEQLTRTAQQFPEVTSVEVFVNGVPLTDALSQK